MEMVKLATAPMLDSAATKIPPNPSIKSFNATAKSKVKSTPVKTEEVESCETILNQVKDMNKTNYRIQLIAAAPGSGSDWCFISIALLTGKFCMNVQNFTNLYVVPTYVIP